jgi:non-canonical (house-cleaning) NTP pyrophosphatase
MSSVVVVGSANQLKIDAVRDAFGEGWEVKGLNYIQSCVSEEPMGKEETLEGARHRAFVAKEKYPNVSECAATHLKANFWVGIESGFEVEGSTWIVFVSLVILVRKCYEATEWEEFQLWSAPLVCPITKAQRRQNICQSLKQWRSPCGIEGTYHSKDCHS